MHSTKEEVIEILKGLPDNTTLEEIQYHLYVRQKIERGIKDIEEGRTFTQEEMEGRIEDDRISILGLIHGRRNFQTAWGEDNGRHSQPSTLKTICPLYPLLLYFPPPMIPQQ